MLLFSCNSSNSPSLSHLNDRYPCHFRLESIHFCYTWSLETDARRCVSIVTEISGRYVQKQWDYLELSRRRHRWICIYLMTRPAGNSQSKFWLAQSTCDCYCRRRRWGLKTFGGRSTGQPHQRNVETEALKGKCNDPELHAHTARVAAFAHLTTRNCVTTFSRSSNQIIVNIPHLHWTDRNNKTPDLSTRIAVGMIHSLTELTENHPMNTP